MIKIFESPILVFGGPYSNLQATQALRLAAEDLNIEPSHCICTGDAIAYCAQPNETIDELRDWGINLIAGNCEQAIVQDALDCGCGFEQGSTCDALSAQWFEFSKHHISFENRQWLATLPGSLRFQFYGLAGLVFHGSPKQTNQFLFPSSLEEEFEQAVNQESARLLLGGHSGLPFTRQLNSGAIWHNAGAIGMPANDGSKNTWYSIISQSGSKLVIETRALHYPFAQAAQKMRELGLDNGYCQALESGLWPSIDVLPKEDARRAGEALSPLRTEHQC